MCTLSQLVTTGHYCPYLVGEKPEAQKVQHLPQVTQLGISGVGSEPRPLRPNPPHRESSLFHVGSCVALAEGEPPTGGNEEPHFLSRNRDGKIN